MKAKKPKDTRKIAYLPPGIYGVMMLGLLYPPGDYRVIIRRPPKTKRKKR